MPWTAEDLPDLRGCTVVVTGASSGLGEATTIALATRGAHVVLATRSTDKTAAVMERIRQRRADASLEHVPLDLADLGSVRRAAEALAARHDRIDRIVANAGVMATPERRTADGSELQFGVNHLGHHAFVGLLLPQLLAAPAARVVAISSGLHWIGRLDPDDPNGERTRYNRWIAYGRSKLANLLYVSELQRRFDAARVTAIAVAVNPGYVSTSLQTTGPTMQGGVSGAATGVLYRISNALIARSVGHGVLPQLYVTTAPGVPGDSYWEPSGPAGLWGYPVRAGRSPAASDEDLGRRLWLASEELTDVRYDLLPDRG